MAASGDASLVNWTFENKQHTLSKCLLQRKAMSSLLLPKPWLDKLLEMGSNPELYQVCFWVAWMAAEEKNRRQVTASHSPLRNCQD